MSGLPTPHGHLSDLLSKTHSCLRAFARAARLVCKHSPGICVVGDLFGSLLRYLTFSEQPSLMSPSPNCPSSPCFLSPFAVAIIFYSLVWLFSALPALEFKLRDFSLSRSQLFPDLERYLAHSGCSVNICRMKGERTIHSLLLVF